MNTIGYYLYEKSNKYIEARNSGSCQGVVKQEKDTSQKVYHFSFAR